MNPSTNASNDRVFFSCSSISRGLNLFNNPLKSFICREIGVGRQRIILADQSRHRRRGLRECRVYELERHSALDQVASKENQEVKTV